MKRALLFFIATLTYAAQPVVLKVEPPNWWPGHTINPVRLLIHGRNLAGARVESTSPGATVGLTRVNAAGSYLFVDLLIDPAAHPGPLPLRIFTADGAATAPFELLAPLPREGRFQGFSGDDVIYLLMPDRFANGDPANDDPAISRGLFDRHKARYYHGGDLQGVIDRLPYLKDLGVTAVWMTPVYDNNNRLNEKERYGGEAITDYHGYGAVDYYAVDEHLGDVAKFHELVDAAHRQGIKIIQDQVANHTGPYHPWVQDSPTPTWFHGTAAHHVADTWQTWTLLDPHATPAMQSATLDGWFIDILPDLNQDDEETARYLIQNTLWWIGISGIDGIRQDTLPYVPRRFWRDWMSAIRRQYPQFKVVGEVFDGDPALVSFFQGGKPRFDGIDSGIDSLFDFPLFFPLRRAFAEGKPLRELANMVAHDYLYNDPDMLVTFLGLHDVARFMNENGATTAGLKLADTVLMTMRGIPMVYYGDEIAMPGGGDPDNRRDFPGGWPGESQDRSVEQQSVFDHLRALTHLRAKLEPLRRGRLSQLLVTDQTWVYARGNVIVAINNDAKPADLDFEAPVPDGSLPDRLGAAPDLHVASGRGHVRLAPRSAAIY